MAMFQKGIIDKYLREIDKDLLDEKYSLLSLESVTSNLALKLKHETLSEEKNITEAFYRDYSAFKRVYSLLRRQGAIASKQR